MQVVNLFQWKQLKIKKVGKYGKKYQKTLLPKKYDVTQSTKCNFTKLYKFLNTDLTPVKFYFHIFYGNLSPAKKSVTFVTKNRPSC